MLGNNLDLVLENEDFISAELDKQKRKLREMSKSLDQQYTLLRLIVQVKITYTTYIYTMKW